MARAIGPIGTATRFVIGTCIIMLGVVFDSAAGGVGWWDVIAAVILLPLIAAACWRLQVVLAAVCTGFGTIVPGARAQADAQRFNGVDGVDGVAAQCHCKR